MVLLDRAFHCHTGGYLFKLIITHVSMCCIISPNKFALFFKSTRLTL